MSQILEIRLTDLAQCCLKPEGTWYWTSGLHSSHSPLRPPLRTAQAPVCFLGPCWVDADLGHLCGWVVLAVLPWSEQPATAFPACPWEQVSLWPPECSRSQQWCHMALLSDSENVRRKYRNQLRFKPQHPQSKKQHQARDPRSCCSLVDSE